jgi:acyl carrier protein phosphodiesterase
VNYLAHLYLSGDDPALRLGNFIADHLKNRPVSFYQPDIQRGIRLHHAIDCFTDQHPVVAESKARLQPEFRKYAPVIVDVFYDHFLAKKWSLYHPQPLPDYAASIYVEMKNQHELLPVRAQEMLPYMERYDWLTNYAHIDGIRRVMNGMSRRARFDSGMERAPEALERDMSAFDAEFELFFPDLQRFVNEFLENNP